MPVEDIQTGHAHLPPAEAQQPRAVRRGLLSRFLGFLRRQSSPETWEPQSDTSTDWSSVRGTFDPALPYTPGRPQKKEKIVTNPLTDRASSDLEPLLSTKLSARFPGIVALPAKQWPAFSLKREELLAVLSFLAVPEFGYQWPDFVTAIDRPESSELELVYALRNLQSGKLVSIHLRVERNEPKVPSAALLFRGFDWHEREVYELYGVQFIDHPDLRKLLLDSNYPGYPMLKGYTDPEHEFIPRPY